VRASAPTPVKCSIADRRESLGRRSKDVSYSQFFDDHSIDSGSSTSDSDSFECDVRRKKFRVSSPDLLEEKVISFESLRHDRVDEFAIELSAHEECILDQEDTLMMYVGLRFSYLSFMFRNFHYDGLEFDACTAKNNTNTTNGPEFAIIESSTLILYVYQTNLSFV
jgi:hypothetical protein